MSSQELFTGERFLPGIEDVKLEVEHYQRYLGVREIVRNKTVLDAACGEGYGSNMIAETAKHVIGLDIDGNTVKGARMTYKSRKNLSFIQGSVAEIPLEDSSVDVVISFETIEHVSQKIQFLFLDEIARVLKKDGLLVMSTPNKKIYSDLFNYANEFHVREFYHDGYIEFLKRRFEYIQMYNQAFQVVSMLSRCDGGDEVLSCYAYDREYDTNGKYYIAMASNRPIEEKGLSSVYLSDSGEYNRNIQRILELQEGEETRNLHIQKLDREADHARKVISELQRENQEKDEQMRMLNLHCEELEEELQEALDREAGCAKEFIAQLQRDNQKKDEQIATLHLHCEELEKGLQKAWGREADCAREFIGQLQRDNQKKDDLITTLNSECEELKKRVQSAERLESELRQIITNKEGHIELLLEVERAFEREKRTHSYRFGKKVQRMGDFLLPPNSRRRFFGRIVANLLKHPKLMFRVITPTRIKHYVKYMKLEGMEGVKRRYEETIDLETAHIDPASRLTLEVVCEQQDGASIKTKAEYERLTIPVWENPTVSIVIPVYNEFDYTYNCVKSVIKNSGNIAYEIIIADDCSTDITREIGTIIENVQLITTEKNVRFLLNCNHAAEHARGNYIFFLNNDTQVQENWLEPLVKLIESDDNVGMVGAKLIYPDGLLQEAGGIVWKDGSAWNYGNRRSPEDPEFNYVKEVDYISGAAIMIRKSLWEEIGGFDARFVPAYYEDTDLAFEVRRRGYKVLYQPLSRVVHFEGISNGTDVQAGLKHYQQVNYQKFYEKWKDVLEREHEINAENVFTAKDRSKNKKHILVIDHYVPHHDQDAGGKCTYMYLKTFVKMGMQVTFIGDNFYKHEPYTTELNQLGIEVLYGNYYYNNWQEWLKENAHYFEYIYLQRPHISIKYVDIVKKYSNAKVFYFAHDLHHIREYREYEVTKDPECLASSQKWKKIEYELFDKADVGHVVGNFELQKMQEAFPDKPMRNIPLYIYDNLLTDINKDFSLRKDILYVGGFGHPPNIDAVLWFAGNVFPDIVKRYPEIKWHVVGGKVPLEVQKLASENIIIEGFLPDEKLERLYRDCRMAVVPLRYGAGVKGKVVEAAYFQIPLVTTSIGAEGLSQKEHFMVVEDGDSMLAKAICDLYEDYSRLREMSDNGITFIKNYFTLEQAEKVLRMDIEGTE